MSDQNRLVDIMPPSTPAGLRHAKAVTFQLAEVAVPRAMFSAILGRIGRRRASPNPG